MKLSNQQYTPSAPTIEEPLLNSNVQQMYPSVPQPNTMQVPQQQQQVLPGYTIAYIPTVAPQYVQPQYVIQPIILPKSHQPPPKKKRGFFEKFLFGDEDF